MSAPNEASLPGNAADPIIRAEDVFRTFIVGSNRIEVLRGVSLSIQAGEKLFLCGASGAGKTSLLYTLAGLEEPNQGTVFLEEHSLYQLKPARQAEIRNTLMGYVFQNYSLLPELTAQENVMIPAMIGRRESADRAGDLLDKVGLGGRIHHLPAELSGGEQQRVAIARALINDPRVLFADEPTGNLDSKTGADVMDILLDLVSEEGKTLLVVTHDSKLARSGDRTLELADGRLVS